jgi:hypothetical protein
VSDGYGAYHSRSTVMGGSAGLDALWDVNDKFRDMVSNLLKEDLDKMTGRKLVKFVKDNGLHQMVPRMGSELQHRR